MLDWTTIKPALETLFGGMSGLRAVWRDKQRPYVDAKTQATVYLHVRGEDDIGVDDRRFNDLNLPAPAATLEETANGHRRLRLEVRVESFRHDDDRFAYQAATAMRTKLRFGANLAALRAVNLSLASIGDAQDVGQVEQDDRVVSVALFEVVLNAGFSVANEGEENRVFNVETVDNPVDHPDTEFNPPC